MRVYIIGNDGITLCRTAPATVNNGEIAIASNEELHAAPLSAKRVSLAARNSSAPLPRGSFSAAPLGSLMTRRWRKPDLNCWYRSRRIKLKASVAERP